MASITKLSLALEADSSNLEAGINSAKTKLQNTAKKTMLAPGSGPGRGIMDVLPADKPGGGIFANLFSGGSLTSGLVGGLTKALGPMAAVLGPIAIAGAAAAYGLKQVFDGMVAGANLVISLASAASPRAAERWQQVLTDITAVIGRVFVPVLELWTAELRLLGDMLATMLPSMGDVREAFKPLMEVMPEIKEALMPVVMLLKNEFKEALAKIAAIIKLTAMAIKATADILGVRPGTMSGDMASSQNAGWFGKFNYTGIGDIGKQADIAALESGSGQENPQVREQMKTNDLLRTLVQALDGNGTARGLMGFATALLPGR